MRDVAGHKGTFGTVMVVGGSQTSEGIMLGAPVLAGRAALRAGCGLVKLVLPTNLLIPALSMLPSATGISMDHPWAQTAGQNPGRMSVVVGPGLGTSLLSLSVFEDVLSMFAAVEFDGVRIEALSHRSMVLDADAINMITDSILPRVALVARKVPVVMTPHPGEAARLAARLGLTIDPFSHDARPTAASELAKVSHCIVLLKGARTVISDGTTTLVDSTEQSVLAIPGSGDVLAGLLGSLLAQFSAKLRPIDLAAHAVLIHTRAGDAWKKTHHAECGMLASELADAIPGVLRSI
jgi:hydroxyethylthiazole kinase-like uncharacterized protein yjeF